MTLSSTYSRRTGMRAVLASLVMTALVAPSPAARAATLPPGFAEAIFAQGLSNPTAMQFAPDGRLFVAQQGGALRVVKNGVLLPTPFVTLSVDPSGERGLLGVAFHPNFATTDPYVYVYYTVPGGGGAAHNRVSRFTANGDVASGSEDPIVDLDNLSGATNHNGGAIDFGPDGKLYIAVGDNANSNHAQTLASRHGKMLRYNPDGTIPTDNPFYNTATGENRAIWALGLRNPFTFALNPSGSPGMAINDVGQGSWEEVNIGAAGANFSWPRTEGDFNPSGSTVNDTRPRYAYQNDSNTCAITGGTFYNPAAGNFPAEYRGMYFFADFCGGWIHYIDPTVVQPPLLNPALFNTFATGISGPVDLKVGSDGALYYLARGQGRVYRVTYSGPSSGPTGLTAYVNGGSVRLQWNALGGASSYRIEAGTASGLANLVNADIGNVTGFEGLVPPGTYFVRVRGVVGGTPSPVSNQVVLSITTTASCVTPPPVPSGFVANAGGLLAAFAWSPSPSATGYFLEAGGTPGAATVGIPLGPSPAFQTLAPAGTYYTRVRAVNACGSSAVSNEAVLTLACSPTAVRPSFFTVGKSGGVATFNWSNTLGATSYRLQVGTAPGLADIGDLDVGTVTSLAVPLAGVPPRTYYLRVTAVSACGVSAPSSEVVLVVP
jgi:glucose/arabinose dehydrogenase